MGDYSNQKWVTLYQVALRELEHALVQGQITEARAEVAERLEILATMPGLHGYERGAIQDALSNLNVVERLFYPRFFYPFFTHSHKGRPITTKLTASKIRPACVFGGLIFD